MKIYAEYALIDHPKAEKIIEWNPTQESCSEYIYKKFRVPQSLESDGWFRNMKVVEIEEKIDERYFPYNIYHLSYARKYEYYVIEIDDTIEALLELMNTLDTNEYCLVCIDNKFWIENIGY